MNIFRCFEGQLGGVYRGEKKIWGRRHPIFCYVVSLSFYVNLVQRWQLNTIYPLVNDSFITNDHAWKGTVKLVLFQNGLKKKKCRFTQKRNGLIGCNMVSSWDRTGQILSETVWSKVNVESESYPANGINCVVGALYFQSCIYTWRKNRKTSLFQLLIVMRATNQKLPSMYWLKERWKEMPRNWLLDDSSYNFFV